MQAILGTQNSGNINLGAQILMVLGLWIGFYFAHTDQIAKHRRMQTTVVAANSFFILFVMFTSFYNFVILGGTTGGTVASLMIVHGILGLTAELTGIYLILRMRTQLIPSRFRVRNFKFVMRALLGLWTVIVVLGFGIYYFRYLAPRETGVSPVAQLKRSAEDIQIHADELQSAAGRGNFKTAKRHAEHLINLIEGKTGADYGDVDKDGYAEDPGDGVGAINYLQRVREDAAQSGGSNGLAVTIADQVQVEMAKVLSDAKAVIQASELKAVQAQIDELVALSQQLNTGSTRSVPQLEQALNASTGLPTVEVPNVPNAPNTIIVNLKDFAFSPKSLTVQKGATVIFVNQDNAKHTATEDTNKFNSGDLPAGKTFTFVFTDSGTFPYHCEYHGDKGGVDMAGTIVVR
jgi:plastocyanin/uncharacterized membrane protein YozB (DUF420 family)